MIYINFIYILTELYIHFIISHSESEYKDNNSDEAGEKMEEAATTENDSKWYWDVSLEKENGNDSAPHHCYPCRPPKTCCPDVYTYCATVPYIYYKSDRLPLSSYNDEFKICVTCSLPHGNLYRLLTDGSYRLWCARCLHTDGFGSCCQSHHQLLEYEPKKRGMIHSFLVEIS